jgi:uncharacterized membrane protein YeiH
MELTVNIIMMVGIFAFAISGALTAMHKKFDVFGIIIIIAFITSVGGGTIRDVLIYREVFWITDPTYTYIILGGSVFAIIFKKWLNYLRTTLLFFDTIGLGLFTILGAGIGLSFNLNYVSCIIIATITGVAGGILRDVLVNEIPVIFRKEIYATISIAGASLYLILKLNNINYYLTELLPVFFIIILRFIVIKFEISLPNIYKKEK